MAISLQKGGNVNLSKTDPNLKQVLVGLGWDARSTDGVDFDLDASIFMVTENGRVRFDSDFIFYGQLRRLQRSVFQISSLKRSMGSWAIQALRSKAQGNLKMLMY